jgi:rhodanese-related sulfurtransferase
MMRRAFVLGLLSVAILAGQLQAQQASSSEPAVSVPAAKQTVLNLYATSKEAFGRWQKDQENVKIIDVRTPEEYAFIGHAPMAWNIPLMLVTHEWSPDRTKLAMKPNPDFIEQVKKAVKPTDTVMIMCRSGARSKVAVNLLAEEGFKNVYQIHDGFEGDSVKDPESVFFGQRMKNGWRNSGLPWTYKLNAEIVQLPTADND